MVILGIDTAIRCTGYGIISVKENSFKALDCDIIKNSKVILQSQCLKRLAEGIRKLISNYNIDVAAIGGAFYLKNIRITMIGGAFYLKNIRITMIGYAKSCVMRVPTEADIPAYTYSPKEVKLSAGTASKQQVHVIMSSLFGIDISNIENDAADALGLPLCHADRTLQSGSEFFINKPI